MNHIRHSFDININQSVKFPPIDLPQRCRWIHDSSIINQQIRGRVIGQHFFRPSFHLPFIPYVHCCKMMGRAKFLIESLHFRWRSSDRAQPSTPSPNSINFSVIARPSPLLTPVITISFVIFCALFVIYDREKYCLAGRWWAVPTLQSYSPFSRNQEDAQAAFASDRGGSGFLL